ncbi:class I SAM-dependent RNA methyltransferase [Marinivivus vitaminiproducens]|uniref:class I SAM-dependent RNA methyltransferase n=1 Tax=Marinivivus vitaminiproducens TaxID=3035935 RepID=UPI002797E9A3|nr:class I SAM-dependent RNA methyltransferase [Geminicoccaceae bacterium SCSIO 64248]
MNRRPRPAKRRSTKPKTAQVELEVVRLGHRGDGIAHLEGKPVFVADSLPGERVLARIEAGPDGRRAQPTALLRAVERAEPPCPHYEACGGCRAQHMPEAVYAAWRLDQVKGALAAQGLPAVDVTGPVPTPPHSRRRARLAFRKTGGRTVLGFRARASHRIVDLSLCLILLPELVRLFTPLRDLLGQLACGNEGEIGLTATDAGPDLLLHTAQTPGLADREALAAFAQAHDLARVAWKGPDDPMIEILAERRTPSVDLGGIAAALPPDAFLQASKTAQRLLQERVVDAVRGAARIADLFSGCGTFTLPLAQQGAHVHAVEGSAAMAGSLQGAARLPATGGRVTVETRDLFARPLTPTELGRFDAVVLDPPRAGARAQCEALAASPVRRAVMVSCHPASFARDAAILHKGGWRLAAVDVIDAFLWSDQVELVAAFGRDGEPASEKP